MSEAYKDFPPSRLLEQIAATPSPLPLRGSVRWYMNRVAVMQPLEMPHRVAAAASALAGRAVSRLGLVNVPKPRPNAAARAPWLLGALSPPTTTGSLALLSEADAIASGDVLRLDGLMRTLGTPVNWLMASHLGTAHATEDIRHEMELHRHGHLVRLAQAWRIGQDPRHLAALLDQLSTWMDQCVYPEGVAWKSALDAALRLLNWSIVWQLLDAHHSPHVPQALRDRWISSVYVHAKFVRANRARHSSANNHLIGELVGLLAARSTWPLWHDLIMWGHDAAKELTVQALRQTHHDGVGREQASWYQVFVFELLSVFLLVQRSLGHPVDERVLRRMAAMARHAAALTDAGGHLSHHGDADNAFALQLAPPTESGYCRILALAVGLRLMPEVAPLRQQPSVTCAWLLGTDDWKPPGSSANALLNAAKERALARRRLPRVFPDGGYYLLGRKFGEPNEVLLTVDAGPLGYLGIAAHGHADALSVRLSVRGTPILVDRGTYTYNTEPRWRHYLRGTLAHNTVTIDGADQSEYGGPFLWLRKTRCLLASFSSQDTAGHVEASHDGYLRLPNPLTHVRRVEWHGADSLILVKDQLVATGQHDIAIAWHFAPDCEVNLTDDGATVRVHDTCLRFTTEDPSNAGYWDLHLANPESTLGWHAPRFGTLVPAPTLLWRTRSLARTELATRIQISHL